MLKLYERGDGEYRTFLQNVIEKKLTASEQGGTHCKQTGKELNITVSRLEWLVYSGFACSQRHVLAFPLKWHFSMCTHAHLVSRRGFG